MALHSPLEIGTMSLKHRIAMSAMTRLRNDPKTEAPRELNAEYYAQRSSLGGLIISEGTHPFAEGRGYIRAPGIWTEPQLEGWKTVTKAVHEKGAYIFCQLMHTGRVSHSSLLPEGVVPVAPSPVKMEGLVHVDEGKAPYEVPKELTIDEIPQLFQRLAGIVIRNDGFS